MLLLELMTESLVPCHKADPCCRTWPTDIPLCFIPSEGRTKGHLKYYHKVCSFKKCQKTLPLLPFRQFTGQQACQETSKYRQAQGSAELGIRRVNQGQLWLLIYRLKRQPPDKEGGRAAGCRRQPRPNETGAYALSLSSGSAGDYSGAPSHTKINKQFQRSPGNFATLNKSLQSQLWLHFTLTSSLTVPSFQDQLEARAERIKTKQNTRSNQAAQLSPSLIHTWGEPGSTGSHSRHLRMPYLHMAIAGFGHRHEAM